MDGARGPWLMTADVVNGGGPRTLAAGVTRREAGVLVSVIIPTYARPRSTRAAVASALSQQLAGDTLEVIAAEHSSRIDAKMYL